MTTGPTIKRSAVVSGAALAQLQPLFERVIGVVLLAFSFLGTMMLLQGGWVVPLTVGGLVAGALVQLLLTSMQWIYRGRRRSWPYVTSLVVDTALSVGGYASVLLVPLLRVLPFGEFTESAAWGIIVAAAFVLALLPEMILVDSGRE